MTASTSPASRKLASGPSTSWKTNNARRVRKLGAKTRPTDGSNIFRWYRAGWGRYQQGDAFGLDSGSNLFVYAGANPVASTDPLGLFEVKKCGLMTGVINQAVNGILHELDNCLGCAPQKKKVADALRNATIQCGGLNDLSLCGEADGPRGRKIYLNPIVVNNVRPWGNRGRGPFGFPGMTCDCLPGLILHEAVHNAFDADESLSRTIARKCFSCAR